MKQTDKNFTQLRQKAEAKLALAPQTKPIPRPAEEFLRELQVHQVELEAQNDGMRLALVAFEEALERSIDFYDMAPVGYCTVSEDGFILQANRTTATLPDIAKGGCWQNSRSAGLYSKLTKTVTTCCANSLSRSANSRSASFGW